MTRSFRAALLAAPLLATTVAGAARAGGFYLQEQSVRAAGRAFSGEVADVGAASLWWNPAASAGVAHGEIYGGFSAILPSGNVDNVNTLIVRPGQAPARVGGVQRSHNPINDGYLPSGAAAFAITPRLSVGIAATSPYSFTTNYESASWERYTADKTKLRTFDIQPSLAYALTPALRVGAAVNVEYAWASLSNSLPNLSPLLPDGHQTLKGDGWDVGYTVGAQFAPGPLTVGVSYKSSVRHKLGGVVTTAGLLGPLAAQNRAIATDATFRTPWQLIFGGRLRATDRLTLNGQVVRFGWNRFDAIRLGAPLSVAVPEGYRRTWSFAGGADYDLTRRVTLRGGIQYDQTPTRDRARDARVPDGNRWNFALGASYKATAGLTFDVAANYLTVKDVAINRNTAFYTGTPAQTVLLVDGRLDKANVVVLATGARLAF